MLTDFLNDALNWVEGFGIWGPVVFILVYAAAVVFMVPASILTGGAGTVFGLVQGSILVSIASTLGASLSFLIGRYVARDRIEKLIDKNPKFKTVKESVENEGWKIVALTRLSPVFPFTFLNYAYGVTRVKFSHYVLASWISMMPGTVMFVYIGSLARLGAEPPGTAQIILRIVGLLATIAITVYITKIARKALQEKIDDN